MYRTGFLTFFLDFFSPESDTTCQRLFIVAFDVPFALSIRMSFSFVAEKISEANTLLNEINPH